MQLRIAQIQEDCHEEERKVDEHRKRIFLNLEENQAENRRGREDHLAEIQTNMMRNQEKAKQLKTILTTFSELPTND